MGFAGSWNEFWISRFSQCRFESIGPALRNVGVEGRQFRGTAYDKAHASGFDAMVSAFPPVLSPKRVTTVTKFFCTDTEPQHGPHARITAIRMIVERSTDGASPSIETSPASFPRRTNVTGLGPAEK
jgi:hypothetical protein